MKDITKTREREREREREFKIMRRINKYRKKNK